MHTIFEDLEALALRWDEEAGEEHAHSRELRAVMLEAQAQLVAALEPHILRRLKLRPHSTLAEVAVAVDAPENLVELALDTLVLRRTVRCIMSPDWTEYALA